MKRLILASLVSILFWSIGLAATKTKDSGTVALKDVSLHGLSFRSIGPAVTGGRIAAIAVHPENPSTYYVGSGHGNLWKTTNRGITFEPVFDDQGAYAIGAIAIDPKNPTVVWVGTGVGNCQSNAGYGDGIYKSRDAGTSWTNMGLKDSEHIGGIAIDPEHPDTVFVAAYGSLRRPGGDRGIFKTVDGGKTWDRVLFVSETTGFFQVHMDPKHPNILYASAHQRMRKHDTNIWGGPESGIYRTVDSGENWEKLTQGLPKEDMGRIGLAISEANPDIVYAIVQAMEKEKGFYRSLDRGMSWSKQSDYNSSYPFYFQKIVADPIDPDRVYSMDVFMQVTQDGGKTWKRAGSQFKHVDDHCLWINPKDSAHLIAGCDGGVYESYDRGKSWSFKSNIPIAEIYKVATDNAKPFYNVYIGTQDNNSLFGPSRTINSGGLTNNDWLFTNSGDGFESQVDWKDPNIVYAQSQYGGLVRFDKPSGENLFIKPQDVSEEPYLFDWDAALIISKHDNKRLYFGSNKVLKTEDRGSTWQEISPDLTRGVRVEFENLMGRSWSIDQLVGKSTLATIVALAESPLDEQKLFAGSADGLIHYSDNGGETWNLAQIKGLPEYSRIHQIVASQCDKDVAYAACHNLLGGDYRPYLFQTVDGGKTWKPINGDLPQRGSTYTIAEDHVKRDLLFVGTQFGVFFSVDGGQEWIRFKQGIPSHCVMDLEIQREHDDLVVSTFGRGVYILDDYSPLRHLTPQTLEMDAELFPIKPAPMFVPANPFGFPGIGFMGAGFYAAKNPPIGAVFSYYLRDDVKTLKEQRREKEKELQKEGKDIEVPSYETLKAEKEELETYLILAISDEEGTLIRNIKTEAKKGLNRVFWDFRTDPYTPISLSEPESSVPWEEPDKGFMVQPGQYRVSLRKVSRGAMTELVSARPFTCYPLNLASLPAEDQEKLAAFNQQLAELTRVVVGAESTRKELVEKMTYLNRAIERSFTPSGKTLDLAVDIDKDLRSLDQALNGDPLVRRFKGGVPTSVRERVEWMTGALWNTTAAPTHTFLKAYEAASAQVESILDALRVVDGKIENLETMLEDADAPHTPGRIPSWKK